MTISHQLNPRSPPVANTGAVGLHAIDRTGECPPWAKSNVPESGSHTRTVYGPQLAVARRVPSGDHANEVTQSVWVVWVVWVWPVSGSHTRTVRCPVAGGGEAGAVG